MATNKRGASRAAATTFEAGAILQPPSLGKSPARPQLHTRRRPTMTTLALYPFAPEWALAWLVLHRRETPPSRSTTRQLTMSDGRRSRNAQKNLPTTKFFISGRKLEV